MRRSITLRMRQVSLASLIVGLTSLLVFVVRPSITHASAGTFTQYTYSGSAGSRPYYVYTPANYQPGTSVPLIVMLHGCTQTPTDFADGTQMNALADHDQFIVVYPQQTSTYNSSMLELVPTCAPGTRQRRAGHHRGHCADGGADHRAVSDDRHQSCLCRGHVGRRGHGRDYGSDLSRHLRRDWCPFRAGI